MIDNIKKKVSSFRRMYLPVDITENALTDALSRLGYTVIYYNTIYNDDNVSQVINNLNLGSYINRNNGFTFANEKFRLTFVNEDLTEEERIIVLAHELGHIVCEHMTSNPILGQYVKQEHEANEFAHYLLYTNNISKTKLWMRKHKKIIAIVGVCVILVATAIAVIATVTSGHKNNSEYSKYNEYSEYYITDTGSKYHKADCIFVKNKDNVHRMTKEEYESGKYDPCKTCLPLD